MTTPNMTPNPNWTSNFAMNSKLSGFTHACLEVLKEHPEDINAWLTFYQAYFMDVVPVGVVVEHITKTPPSDNPVQHPDRKTREELQLLAPSAKILMSGLVSTEMSPDEMESVAGDETYARWYPGIYAPKPQDWYFFTGRHLLRIFISLGKEEYKLKGEYDPISQAGEVAEFLLQALRKLEPQ